MASVAHNELSRESSQNNRLGEVLWCIYHMHQLIKPSLVCHLLGSKLYLNHACLLYTTKLLGGILVSLTPSLRPLSVCSSVCPAFRVHSVTPRVLDGFFPSFFPWPISTRSFHIRHKITSMRGCVVHNDLWPWPISSRSFRHDFAIKLLKYGTSCGVHSSGWIFSIFGTNNH